MKFEKSKLLGNTSTLHVPLGSIEFPESSPKKISIVLSTNPVEVLLMQRNLRSFKILRIVFGPRVRRLIFSLWKLSLEPIAGGWLGIFFLEILHWLLSPGVIPRWVCQGSHKDPNDGMPLFLPLFELMKDTFGLLGIWYTTKPMIWASA